MRAVIKCLMVKQGGWLGISYTHNAENKNQVATKSGGGGIPILLVSVSIGAAIACN